jgi:uncharacterized membrane protein
MGKVVSRQRKAAITAREAFVNLILMPILASIFGVCVFLVPILAGCAMLRRRTTAHRGKAVVVYAAGSLLVGLACVWIGFALMLLAWRLGRSTPSVESASILFFWASGPFGIALGFFLARRLIKRTRH